MSRGGVEVLVDVGALPEVNVGSLERAVRRTLANEGVGEAEVSLTLLGDDAIRELNHEYLGHDRVTDVIAFTLSSKDEAPLGDVYIGVEQAARQATDFGVSFKEELVRLAVHGTLHVLGYDHPEGPERDRGEMFTRQEALVRELVARDQS